MSVPPALELRGIRKRFGATEALRGVSLSLAPGEVHALIGENGAGKSTLMKVLSGAHQPDAGEMALAGRPYRPAGPPDARRRGVAMIYQELTLAPHLSARENILLGLEPARAGWIDVTAARAAARDALAQLGHGELDLERPAGAFGIAERQIIEIARALVGRPGVLILDEPTSSLTGADTERLFAVIARLRDQGVSIIYISHFLEECRRLCDRYTVLKDGASVGSGRMAETTPDALVTLMTGREVRDLYPRNARAPGAPLLEVQALAGGPRLRGADCVVRAGEIFGLAGLVGAGRTELLRAVFGLDPRNAGGVRFGGEDAAARPRGCWAQGVGFLSEDRKEEGLLLSQPLGDNLTLTKLGAFSRAGWIDAGR
jgi:ribose transport system ATP-binding protein